MTIKDLNIIYSVLKGDAEEAEAVAKLMRENADGYEERNGETCDELEQAYQEALGKYTMCFNALRLFEQMEWGC